MATARLKSGKVVQVPDGLPHQGAVQDWLLRNGATFEEVGIEPVQPETSGGLENFLIGAGEFFSDRIPSLRNEVRAPSGLAAGLGRAAPGVVASFALPGSGLAGIISQAALSAGLEALDPASTRGSIAEKAAWAGAGTLAGDMVGRVVSGIARAGRAARGGTYLDNTSEALRTVSETAGGRGWINRLNQKVIHSKLAQSFGQQADEITDDVLRQAADDLGAGFDNLIPRDTVIKAPQALSVAENLNIGPRAKALMPSGGGTALQGDEFLNLRAALQKRAADVRGSDFALADDISWVIEQLDDAAEAALGPSYRTEFRALREMWKNLKVTESLSAVRKGGGDITPAALASALGSQRGYGTSYIRDTGKVLPATQELFDVAKVAVKDAAGRVANSGTATRAAGLGLLAGGAGLATGQTSPEAAATGLLAALGAQGAGLASVGRVVPALGQVGAASGRVLAEEAERRRE